MIGAVVGKSVVTDVPTISCDCWCTIRRRFPLCISLLADTVFRPFCCCCFTLEFVNLDDSDTIASVVKHKTNNVANSKSPDATAMPCIAISTFTFNHQQEPIHLVFGNIPFDFEIENVKIGHERDINGVTHKLSKMTHLFQLYKRFHTLCAVVRRSGTGGGRCRRLFVPDEVP
jgi:hypothetical protein